jgi:hypothetical protein
MLLPHTHRAKIAVLRHDIFLKVFVRLSSLFTFYGAKLRNHTATLCQSKKYLLHTDNLWHSQFSPLQKKEIKIAILGSRTFEDYNAMCSFIEEKLATMEHPAIEAVVSGGAIGADSLAERYAQERGLEIALQENDTRP